MAKGRLLTEMRSIGLKGFWRLRRKTAALSVQAVLLVLAVNAGSKVVGFVREVYVSALYGVSQVTDAFFAIQQLPLFVSTYLFGAFTLVFVPHYAAAKRDGYAKQFLVGLLKVLVPVGIGATTLMMLGATGPVLSVVGIGQLSGSPAVGFAVILSLSLLPTIFWGVGYGVAHAERQHVRGMMLAALAPLVMLAALVFLTLVPVIDPAYALPWSFVIGVLAGGVWGLGLILKRMKDGSTSRHGLSWRRGFSSQLSAASLENVGFSLNQLLNVHFAGATGAGAVAVNAYALRISMLALSGMMTPLNQVIQGTLSSEEARDKTRHFAKILGGMVVLVLLIMAAMLVFRQPLVRFIYERGAFAPADTLRVVRALVPYSAYFAVMALNQLFARYLFVVSKGRLYTICLLAGYLVANCLKPFFAASFGLPGIIWACVIGEGLALACLSLWFAHRLWRAT